MTVTICLTQNCKKKNPTKNQQTKIIFAKKIIIIISLSIITIIFFVVKTYHVLLYGS